MTKRRIEISLVPKDANDREELLKQLAEVLKNDDIDVVVNNPSEEALEPDPELTFELLREADDALEKQHAGKETKRQVTDIEPGEPIEIHPVEVQAEEAETTVLEKRKTKMQSTREWLTELAKEGVKVTVQTLIREGLGK